MTLKRLTVQGFRGFNEIRTIEFSPALTLVYGRNGTGKTSLGEALEWLLYGATTKRQRGDEISKREYRDTYRNVHFDGPGKPYVQVVVKATDGHERVLRRELNDDETSEVLVDGDACPDFSHLGVASPFDRPMILQHTLQDFIHMEPKSRYRALSAILGLDSLMMLRSHVDTLHGLGGYQRDKPGPAKDARASTEDLRMEASRHGEAAAFHERLTKLMEGEAGQLPAALAELRRLVAGALGEECPDDRLQAALRAEKARMQKAVLDWARYETRPVPQTAVAWAQGPPTEVLRKARELPVTTADRTRAGKPLTEKESSFYALALELRTEEDPQRCPLCGQPTLTPERVAELENAARSGAADHERLVGAQKTLAELRAGISELSDQWTKVLPVTPTEDVLSTLSSILPPETEQQAAVFSASARDLSTRQQQFEQALGRLDQSLHNVNLIIAGRGASLPPPSVEEHLRAVSDRLGSLLAAATTYSKAYASLSSPIERSLSSRQEVQYLDFLARAWDRRPEIEIAAEDRHIEARLLGFRRKLMDFIKNKQREVLAQKQNEIRHWYEALNPDEGVTFSEIQVATDALELIAESYGEQMKAAPNLSCSHLNCVGLAVYLACAAREDAPFHFLFIDDPVQSMDDDHTEAFKTTVLRNLLAGGRQVMLLTHLEHFTDGVDVLFRRQHDVYRLRFADYARDGPQIEPALPRLEQLLKYARGRMNASNDHYRALSVQDLRRFVERFIKDLYVRDTGTAVSARYENKPWSELRKLLPQCNSFDPSDEGRLENTYRFSSAHLHEDDSVPQSVPRPHQIKAHVDDMEAILVKYRAQLGLGA